LVCDRSRITHFLRLPARAYASLSSFESVAGLRTIADSREPLDFKGVAAMKSLNDVPEQLDQVVRLIRSNPKTDCNWQDVPILTVNNGLVVTKETTSLADVDEPFDLLMCIQSTGDGRHT